VRQIDVLMEGSVFKIIARGGGEINKDGQQYKNNSVFLSESLTLLAIMQKI